MLPLEAIAVLAILYLFFMVGTVRALRAKRTKHREDKIEPKSSAAVSPLVSTSEQATGRDG